MLASIRHYPEGIMSSEPLMGVRGQWPLKLKKCCHLEVKFAVFWHNKTTTGFFFVFFFWVWSKHFYIFLGQNFLLAEIRDIAEKDIA